MSKAINNSAFTRPYLESISYPGIVRQSYQVFFKQTQTTPLTTDQKFDWAIGLARTLFAGTGYWQSATYLGALFCAAYWSFEPMRARIAAEGVNDLAFLVAKALLGEGDCVCQSVSFEQLKQAQALAVLGHQLAQASGLAQIACRWQGIYDRSTEKLAELEDDCSKTVNCACEGSCPAKAAPLDRNQLIGMADQSILRQCGNGWRKGPGVTDPAGYLGDLVGQSRIYLQGTGYSQAATMLGFVFCVAAQPPSELAVSHTNHDNAVAAIVQSGGYQLAERLVQVMQGEHSCGCPDTCPCRAASSGNNATLAQQAQGLAFLVWQFAQATGNGCEAGRWQKIYASCTARFGQKGAGAPTS
jgi:hypothetical protein